MFTTHAEPTETSRDHAFTLSRAAQRRTKTGHPLLRSAFEIFPDVRRWHSERPDLLGAGEELRTGIQKNGCHGAGRYAVAVPSRNRRHGLHVDQHRLSFRIIAVLEKPARREPVLRVPRKPNRTTFNTPSTSAPSGYICSPDTTVTLNMSTGYWVGSHTHRSPS